MQQFLTRQFQAGNSQAVRLPAQIAFPPKTELMVRREGNKIIVEPLQNTLEAVPALFAELGKCSVRNDGEITRPEFIDTQRDW